MLTITPDEAIVTSGDNPSIVGTMGGTDSATITWNVVFPENKTYTLQVRASGYDSNNNPCNVSQSTKLIVGKDVARSAPIDLRFVLVVAIIAIFIVVIGILILRRRRQPNRTDKPEQS
jgi:hypothetical protein